MSRKASKSTIHLAISSPPGWGVILLTALCLTRFLLPTEAADQGLTLWLTSLTFGFAAAYFATQWRFGGKLFYSPSLLDGAVAAIVLGHLVSGAVILLGDGNQRTALNLTWEWCGLGIFWVLVRLLIRQEQARTLLLGGFVSTVVVLSLLGIWQHYIWYPHQARNYESFLELHAQNGRRTLSEQREYKGLVNQFGTDVLTLDEAGQSAYLSRVRDSVEPIGLFVLTNTLAIPLLVALFLLMEQFLRVRSRPGFKTQLILFGSTFLVLFCLILTKSRSAWIGAAGGLFVLQLLKWKFLKSKIGFPLSIWFGAGGLALGLIIWASVTGGLDPQVISEAPKSLQYRLEYWSATLSLLKDFPLLGTGPGNFRQHYLKYKLPGASEEILDPHNLFLGIWCGGGLLALLGLLLFMGLCLSSGIRNPNAQSSTESDFAVTWKQALLPPCLAFALIIGLLFTLQGELDLRLSLLAGCTLSCALLFYATKVQIDPSRLVLTAALVGILIHLLAASGIEMPAIVMLILLLGHLIETPPQGAQQAGLLWGEKSLGAGAIVAGVLLAGCLFTGFLPVQLAQTEIAVGQSLLLLEGKTQLAQRYFQNAVQADSLSPEPEHQLSLLFFRQWQLSAKADDEMFNQAVLHLENAIRLDPYSALRYRLLGNYWDERFKVSQEPEHIQQAIQAYSIAVALYPNFASLQAEYALALQSSGVDGRPAARHALQLDDLNRANGHVDKYLSDRVRAELENMTKQ